MAEGLLSGKRGVILGVANDKSIAWGCAQACVVAGASVAFNYLGESLERRVRKLVDEHLPGSPVFQCNVQNDDEITAYFNAIKQEWGTIDFLIHSIAFAHKVDLINQFVTTSRENFALALDISAYSLVAVAREAAPIMNEGGSIVAMTYYGAEKVIPRYNVMGVAKAALESTAKYLAWDLGEKGIRVNCISAGPIRTLSASAIAGVRLMLRTTEKFAPLRRNVTQDEVGRSAVYLLSDLSSGVTGEVLHVDSGYNIMGMYGVEDAAQEE
jgi:enoyl-[acyl-carrier protein] reductase I